jgi:prepilin-type N-terminal cleavage/methylation domain-containing protein
MFLKQADKKDKENNNQGFSLIEVLIAMAIFSIGIMAIAVLQISGINSNSSARKITDVTYYAENQMETLMSLPWNDANLTDTMGIPYQQQILDDNGVNTGYTMTWNVTDTDLDGNFNADSKIINLTVSHDAFNIGSISMTYIYPRPPE